MVLNVPSTRQIYLILLFLTVMSFPVAALADHNPWTHTIYFENDLFTGTDSNYTNGVKYSLISEDLSPHAHEGKLPRKVLEYVHQLPFIGKSGPEYTHKVEFSLGQNMFTPQDISRSDLITNDRPYAGWTYISTSYHRKYSSAETLDFMDTVELQLGIVGPESFAEQTQKFVHKMRELQRPHGWDNQLKSEPGLAVVFERKWLFHPGDARRLNYRIITHAGGAVGNVYTYLNSGAELRVGWNIPRDFGVSLIRPAGSTRLSTHTEFSMFGFAGVNGRLTFRDIFLDGNTFTDSHSIDKKIPVADLSAGLAINYKNILLTWTQVLRTKEFKGQQDAHSFGAMALSFATALDLSKIINWILP
jgi:lipid A 3-O-deacylase